MIFKKFNYLFVVVSITLCLAVIGFNYINNDYGLFRNSDKLNKKPYAFDSSGERTAKFLLSYRYIPENFNGVLIGPSHSTNINTEQLKSTKLYNASLRGGNITELKLLVEKMFSNRDSNLDYIVISLSPYLTNDSGRKTSSIDPLEYWGSLGSISQLKFMLAKYAILSGLKYDNFNYYGFNDINYGAKQEGASILNEMLTNYKQREVYIDPNAFAELEEMIALLKGENIKILAYIYPRNYELYQMNIEEYNKYEDKILGLFDENDVIWNFNSNEYEDFVKNKNLFFDGSHLTEESAKFIAREIEIKLEEYYSE